jgi:hypothetical protein
MLLFCLFYEHVILDINLRVFPEIRTLIYQVSVTVHS